MTWPGTDAAAPAQRWTLGWALGLNGVLLPDNTPVPMEGTPRGIESAKVPNAMQTEFPAQGQPRAAVSERTGQEGTP